MNNKCILYFIFLKFCIADLTPNDTALQKQETTTAFPISTTSTSSYGELMSSTTTTTENVNYNNCQNDCKTDICIDGLCQNQSTNISTTQDFTEKVNNCQNDCEEQEENSTTTTTIISSVIPLDVTSNCQNGCWGGICYEGICQCKEGLILNVEINDCIMPCESTCQNGVCNQDRICECNQGFIFDTDDDDDLTVTGCVPQCDRKCVNSICVAPTHCECIEGDISMLNISSVLECLPTCEGVDGDPGGCQNGTCVAVNKCQCLDGFFPNPYDRYECIARLTATFDLTRKFLYLLWIISILTLSTVIVIGCLAYKRMRCVSYNIHKIEKLHSTVAFQNNHDQLDCVL